MQDRRETAGITMRLIVEYIRAHHGDAAVTRMMALASETRPLGMLENEAVWSTYDQKIALFAAAAEVTGRDDIARRIGETALEVSVGSTIKVALAMLGSPATLIRGIPRANVKFSTAGEMQAEHVGRSSARLRYRVHDGYTLSHYDCDYCVGLLTNIPKLFGLPAAEVQHETCQVDGAAECIYDLSWRRRRRWSRRPHQLPADTVLSRLHQIQETLGDLVASTSTDEVLDAIATRAGTAVSAERFVLAVHLHSGEPVTVRYDGFDEAVAHQVAHALAERKPLDQDHGHSAVVAVPGFGHLAAFARYPFLDHERELLEAYARLAATALAAVTALTRAEERRHAAEALLGLASSLHHAHTPQDVATAVASASQTVVGSDAAGLLLFDADNETLRVLGHHGFSGEVAAFADTIAIRAGDTPELVSILSEPNTPRIYASDTDDLFIGALLQVLGLGRIAVLPVTGRERTHGVLIAGWFGSEQTPVVGPRLFGKLAGLAAQATNALERAELVERVQLQATTDSLTGVGNRRLLTERLSALISSGIGREQPALLFIDLDRFKVVNDTLGHLAGDELLKCVSRRLLDCVRTDDLVARLGGDEFTVLLPSVVDATAALDLGERIVAALAAPIEVDGRTLHVRCSVGVLLVSAATAGASEALRDADAAMYAAKKAGGNRCVIFDPDRFSSDSDALDLESDLYVAIHEAELHLAFQPQVDLTSGRLVGAECLVRWTHETRGLVPPDRFLPVAEATGMIVPLDLWVLREACEQAAEWWAAGHQLRLAVNVSARTLTDPRFIPSVIEALEESRLPARALEIELTEATAISDTDTVRAVLDALRAQHVSVAVDDLGTGYSSLSWISSFPVDRIKIDRSFVADLDKGGRGEPLVEALIAMAHRLGHDVIAEGVENSAQLRRLLVLGCTEAQGFALGRPGPGESISDLAARGVPVSSV